jgi:hypothetical protein
MAQVFHKVVVCAASEGASTLSFQETGPGASPRAALHDLLVCPIAIGVAKRMLVREHYLHSLPGGTKLGFGIFKGSQLKGAMTFGVGPKNAYLMVDEVEPHACVTLTRFWLSDDLPHNSASSILGVIFRALKKHTELKFIVSYADPSQGHLGTIYQATNWVYTGLSQPMSMYDFGDGVLRHSRSVAHGFGTHSLEYFKTHGVDIVAVPQAPKHRYLYFLDPSCRDRLRVPVLAYPKKGKKDGNS